MTPITELNNLGDLLKYEAPNRYSRDVATIAAGQNLPLGTVLGRNASDGKHYAIDPAATVPEYKVSSPILAPLLIPETMRSGL